MTHDSSRSTRGPFHPEQVRSKDPYELSKGHPIFCNPTGQDGTTPNGLGFAVLNSDPMVKNVGVDTGLDLGAQTLRAPDVAVNFERGTGTWATSTALALEYAGAGQNEAELRTKITELLAGGTRWVWVVRLTGPRRVEVHTKDAAVRVVGDSEELTAPGVLELPVPVRALFDRDAAGETEFRNMLKARGYDGLDGVRREAEQMSAERWREEGREEGALVERRSAVLLVLAARSIALDSAQRLRVEGCRDAELLAHWLRQASVAITARDVFEER